MPAEFQGSTAAILAPQAFFCGNGSPIYAQVFWPLRLPSANPTADKPWKWLLCTIPFLGHLELRRKNWEISYVGIHKDQRKWSKNSL